MPIEPRGSLRRALAAGAGKTRQGRRLGHPFPVTRWGAHPMGTKSAHVSVQPMGAESARVVSVSPRARAVGVAVWREGDAVYVTQEFAAP